jgi:hypothetical protein
MHLSSRFRLPDEPLQSAPPGEDDKTRGASLLVDDDFGGQAGTLVVSSSSGNTKVVRHAHAAPKIHSGDQWCDRNHLRRQIAADIIGRVLDLFGLNAA